MAQGSPGRAGINKQAFLNMLRDLKAIYTDAWFLPREGFAETADVWYQALKVFSYDQLRGAFDAYIASNDKPPTPSQIRELVYTSRSASERAPTFQPERYFKENKYWVLVDLEGFHIAEMIADANQTEDDVAAYFKSRGYDLTGTILTPVSYETYRPQYRELIEARKTEKWQREHKHRFTISRALWDRMAATGMDMTMYDASKD